MSKTVDIQEAQKNLSELLALAQAGDEVVIVENNQPLAKLVPIARRTRIPGLNKGAMTASKDFDEPLPDEFWVGPQ